MTNRRVNFTKTTQLSPRKRMEAAIFQEDPS